MKAGVFMMPSHPPERGFYDGHQWDLDRLELVEQLGGEGAMIVSEAGQHLRTRHRGQRDIHAFSGDEPGRGVDAVEVVDEDDGVEQPPHPRASHSSRAVSW